MKAPSIGVRDMILFAEDLDVGPAAAIYVEHGCLVVRGPIQAYVDQIKVDIDALTPRNARWSGRTARKGA